MLRVGNLDTSNGPALEVWLTDAPVLPGRDGWNVFDDGRYVSLGELKATRATPTTLTLLTRDSRRYRDYFPTVELIAP